MEDRIHAKVPHLFADAVTWTGAGEGAPYVNIKSQQFVPASKVAEISYPRHIKGGVLADEVRF